MAETEPTRIQDLVKFETDARFCREVKEIDATDVAAGTALACGDLLQAGSNTAQYKLLAGTSPTAVLLGVYGPASSYGSELQTAYTMPDPAVDLKCLVLNQGPAIIDHAYVDYQSQTEATCNAALAVLDILVRTGPTYTKQEY